MTVVLLVLFLCHITHSATAQINHESNLHDFLFKPETNSTLQYNPYVRPVRRSSKKIDIEVRLGIKRVFEMDEFNHRVNLFAILIKKWKDEFLRWDSKDFGNITHIWVDYAKIWTPQINLISEYNDEKSSGSDRSVHRTYEKYPVKLFSNGNVEFIPSLHMESECIFNYKSFPFEFQLCDFHFQMPYNSKQVELRMASFYTQEYHKYTPIWSINNINHMDTLDSSKAPVNILRVTFKRTMKSYMFTMPSYIVYILTLLMFLLPQQSNQRIIIGSTCLVISTILSYMLSTDLPRNDISAWPIVGKLYLFNTILLTFSLLFSAFIINISNAEHSRSVPDWLKKFTVNILAKVFCVQAVAFKVFNEYQFKVHDEENSESQINNMILMSPIDQNTNVRVRFTNNSDSNNESAQIEGTETNSLDRSETIDNNEYGLTKLLKSIHGNIGQLRDRMQIRTYKKCAGNEWLLVAILVDKMFFFVYCFIVVFVTTTIFNK